MSVLRAEFPVCNIYSSDLSSQQLFSKIDNPMSSIFSMAELQMSVGVFTVLLLASASAGQLVQNNARVSDPAARVRVMQDDQNRIGPLRIYGTRFQHV